MQLGSGCSYLRVGIVCDKVIERAIHHEAVQHSTVKPSKKSSFMAPSGWEKNEQHSDMALRKTPHAKKAGTIPVSHSVKRFGTANKSKCTLFLFFSFGSKLGKLAKPPDGALFQHIPDAKRFSKKIHGKGKQG